MTFNWNKESIESKADKDTELPEFGELGDIGRLIYHNFRFTRYIIEGDDDGRLLAYPVCDEKNPPDITPKDGLTGKAVLTGLCDLARRIDDFKEPLGYMELIDRWCRENMHPYAIDSLYSALTEDHFKPDGLDAELAARDGIFSVDGFMAELGKLYHAARLYIALERLCFAGREPAFDLCEEGRYFERLPILERYKHGTEEPRPPKGELAAEPCDDYERLRSALTDCIPNFKLRLKVNPLTGRLVFSADVYSVFDIAWYTLAQMMTEDPAPESIDKEAERPEGVMICCCHCGRFFIRSARHQQYCDKAECQKARNAKNQRDFRRRRAIEKAQTEKEKTEEGCND